MRSQALVPAGKGQPWRIERIEIQAALPERHRAPPTSALKAQHRHLRRGDRRCLAGDEPDRLIEAHQQLRLGDDEPEADNCPEHQVR